MKRLLALTFTITLVFVASTTSATGQNRPENGRNGTYRQMLDLVEEGNFVFRARRAFPQLGGSIDLTGNHGIIEFSDNRAKSALPFFGRAYTPQYGAPGGIRFSGEMNNVEISENPDRKRIRYSFEIRDLDHYRVSMDISHDGRATVSITSNNRSPMRYEGEINPS